MADFANPWTRSALWLRQIVTAAVPEADAVAGPAGNGLLRSVAQTFSCRVLQLGLSVATMVLVTRSLGPAGRGTYAVAMSLGIIGVQLANCGLHMTYAYYVARDRGLLAPLTGNVGVIALGASGISAGLVAVCLAFPQLAPVRGTALYLGAAWIPFGLAYLLFQHLLIGVHEVAAYNAIETANKLLALAAVAIVALARRARPELFLTVGLLVIIVSCAWAYARLHSISVPRVSWAAFRRTAGFGVKAQLVSLFGFLVLRLDLLMVQYMLGPEKAGYYSISASLADTVALLPVVVATLVFPRLSAAAPLAALALMKGAAKITGLVMAPLVVTAALVAEPTVAFMFGKAFAPAVEPFIWLLPGIFFLGVEIVAVQWLNSLGLPAPVIGVWAVILVLNIAGNLWAIPRFGIAGASLVSSLSYLTVFLCMAVLIALHARRIRNEARTATGVAEVQR